MHMKINTNRCNTTKNFIVFKKNRQNKQYLFAYKGVMILLILYNIYIIIFDSLKQQAKIFIFYTK